MILLKSMSAITETGYMLLKKKKKTYAKVRKGYFLQSNTRSSSHFSVLLYTRRLDVPNSPFRSPSDEPQLMVLRICRHPCVVTISEF